MLEFAGSINTQIRDALESPERGVRRWSMVAIPNDAWFQVESCSHADGLPSVTTYILAELESALTLVRRLQGNTWTELRLYSRMPSVAQNGFILEPIEQIVSTQDGTHIFFLSSGITIYRSAGNWNSPVSFAGVKEIYRSR